MTGSLAAASVAGGRLGARPLWLILPAAAVLSVFLLLPYLNIVVISLRPSVTGAAWGDGFTLANFARVLSDGYFMGVLFETVSLGLKTALICLLLGYPVAFHLARTQSRWKGLLYVFVLSPLLVGLVVRSFGWLILLSGNGVINQLLRDWGLISMPIPLMNNSLGVTIALVHVFLPFMILPLIGAIQSIDPNLALAARSLGARPFTVFRKIWLPLSWPGIQAGCILVFVLTLSAYVTPVMLGGAQVKTMAVLVVQALIDNFRWPLGAALALVLAGTGALAVWLFVRTGRSIMKGIE
ncbi:MAG: putative spermidine/putrescine transport system, permease protein PotB [Pseudomonadota bacterium]